MLLYQVQNLVARNAIHPQYELQLHNGLVTILCNVGRRRYQYNLGDQRCIYLGCASPHDG